MQLDWMTLVLGWVLGSLVTSVLVWAQRGTQATGDTGYFRQLALSIIATAAVATAVRAGIYAMLNNGGGSVEFGVGWMIGGLLAAWFLTRSTRST